MLPSKLNLFYQNVRGLRTKTSDVRQNILTHNYDVILITESWLPDSVYNGEICDNRYDVFRCDRSIQTSTKSTGGGAMVCIRRTLHAQERTEWTCDGLECVWVTVPARSLGAGDKTNLHICTVYIAGSDNHASRLIAFTKLLTEIYMSCSNDNFIITGDFNLSGAGVSWSPSGPIYVKRGSVELQEAAISLIDACSLSGLTQYNLHKNSSNNILDLIFSNTQIEVSRSCVSLVKNEDKFHPSLEIDASDLMVPCLKRLRTTKYCFYKADYDIINDYFANIDWVRFLDGDTMDEVTEKFYSYLRSAIGKHVPKKVVSNSGSYPIWYSRSLVHIIKDKVRAHSRWKAHGNPRDYDEFSILRARQKKIQKKCYESYKEHMQLHLKKDPKHLWTYMKSLRAGNSGYPNSLTWGDKTLNNETEICTGFNDFFESVFQKPALSYDDHLLSHTEPEDTVHSLHISEGTVSKLLRCLDEKKGPGTDGIPPVFIKKCAKTLSKPLCIIFTLSVNVFGVFPEVWKEARIVPIHKSSSRGRVENYRPISILNTFSKIFEKTVYKTICTTIFKAIPNEQHGFMNKRSTVTNLAIFTNYVYRCMDERSQVDVIYTDFEKAFDRVDHIILLHKLYALGIRGDLHRWLSSYITNRKQAVVIGSARSDFVNISSGVPQGSILGPLLYIAYLFDISDSLVNSKYLMFADDKKVFLKIKTLSDCEKFKVI